MILNTDDKLFTLYWHDGKREVVVGTDGVNAVARAGYGGGAPAPLDWFDTGVTDTHYYVRNPKGAWVKRSQEDNGLRCSLQQISRHDGEVVDLMEGHSLASLKPDLEMMHGLFFELPDMSRIWIDMSIGHYMSGSWAKGLFGEAIQMGWIRALRVYQAEYCQGPYADDGDERCHYMVRETSYFDPKDIDQAILHFQKTIKAHVSHDRGSMDLETYRTFLTAPVAGATSIQQLLETQPIHEL